jgi:hypothetical protein
MTERSYEDAVQVLSQRMGTRWEGLEPDGRDEMARILKRELGYDDAAARDAVGAMIRSGRLRYHRAGGSGGTQEIIGDKPQPIAMSPNATGTPGAPGAGFEPVQGHWEIGTGDEGGWEGRAGQVQPS